jgi:tRNA(fMet)-specific endonuclease VapC
VVGCYVLDTDSLSLYQRGNQAVKRRLMMTKPSERFITVITVEEQMEGRLSYLRGSNTRQDQANANRLRAALDEMDASMPPPPVIDAAKTSELR